MAENSRIYMKLASATAGAIKGDSTVDKREDWIELDGWSWNLGRSKAVNQAPEPSPFTFNKEMDRATTGMLQAMLDGTQLNATIVIDDGSLERLELTLELKKVTIRDYNFSTEISDKGGLVKEDWTFDYSSITFKYRHDTASGTKEVTLDRADDASSEKPSTAKENEFRKLASSLLRDDFSVAELSEVWKDILKTYNEERKGPGAQATPHLTQETPE